MADQLVDSTRRVSLEYGVKFLYGCRTYVLCVFLLFCAYVSLRANTSNNWDHTRQLGFAEPNYCNEPGVSYTVDFRNINSNSQTSSNKPIMFGKGNKMCFSSAFLDSCRYTLNSMDTKTSVDAFTALFRPQARNYFTYSILFFVLTSVSFGLTFLYESDQDDDDVDADNHQGGAFSGNIKRSHVTFVNHLLNFVVGAMCIVASVTHVFVYQENCIDLYRARAGAKQYCQQLNSCGMVLQSVIKPHDVFVTNYADWMMMWGIVIFVVAFVRCVITATGAHKPHYFQHIPATHDNNIVHDNSSLTMLISYVYAAWQYLRHGQQRNRRPYSRRQRSNNNDDVDDSDDEELGHTIDNSRVLQLPSRPTAPSYNVRNNGNSNNTNTNNGRITYSAATVVPITTTTPVVTPVVTPHPAPTTSPTTLTVATQVAAAAAVPARARRVSNQSDATFYQHLSPDDMVNLNESDECTICLAPLKPTLSELQEQLDNMLFAKPGEDSDDNYRRNASNPKKAQALYKTTLLKCLTLASHRNDGDDVNNIHVVRTLRCKHMFHQHCLEEWMAPSVNSNDSCPVCRTKLVT